MNKYHKIKIKRIDPNLNPDIPVPSRAHPSDAGYDIRMSASQEWFNEQLIDATPSEFGKAKDIFWLRKGKRMLIPTNIAMEMPDSMMCDVRARSGLANKHGIMIVNGVGTIDSNYRGHVGVLLYNSSDEDFKIKNGDRIAQLVFQTLPAITLEEVDNINDTNRGTGGFGSTGVK